MLNEGDNFYHLRCDFPHTRAASDVRVTRERFALESCSCWRSSLDTETQGKRIRCHFALLTAALASYEMRGLFSKVRIRSQNKMQAVS